MKTRFKAAAEWAVVRSGLAGLHLRFSRKNVLVLAYHNVVPDSDPAMGDSSLHLPVSRFSVQLDILMRSHKIVSLADLLHSQPARGERWAAITFDDGYRGVLELGLPELRSRGLPSTLFICPGLLGSDGFWWDLAADPGSGMVNDDLKTHVFKRLGGRQNEALAWARGCGVPLHSMPELYRPAPEEKIHNVLGDGDVTLGSHTWSHVNLSTVPPAEAREELLRPKKWFQDRGIVGDLAMSYPYGAASGSVSESAGQVGYGAGFLVHGGRVAHHHLRDDWFSIPRLNVPRGFSRAGFQARVCGIRPL